MHSRHVICPLHRIQLPQRMTLPNSRATLGPKRCRGLQKGLVHTKSIHKIIWSGNTEHYRGYTRFRACDPSLLYNWLMARYQLRIIIIIIIIMQEHVFEKMAFLATFSLSLFLSQRAIVSLWERQEYQTFMEHGCFVPNLCYPSDRCHACGQKGWQCQVCVEQELSSVDAFEGTSSMHLAHSWTWSFRGCWRAIIVIVYLLV